VRHKNAKDALESGDDVKVERCDVVAGLVPRGRKRHADKMQDRHTSLQERNICIAWLVGNANHRCVDVQHTIVFDVPSIAAVRLKDAPRRFVVVVAQTLFNANKARKQVTGAHFKVNKAHVGRTDQVEQHERLDRIQRTVAFPSRRQISSTVS
jgi:hypothetical protein